MQLGDEFMTGDESVRKALPKRMKNSHKGDYGKLCVLAGSKGLSGAACFATLAAIKTGAGLVTLACPDVVYDIVAGKCLEAMSRPLKSDNRGCIAASAVKDVLRIAEESDVVLVGCGLGKGKGVTKVISSLVEEANVPMIIDADGINAINKNSLNIKDRKVVMTPHDGELSRFHGEEICLIGEERHEAALRLSKTYGVVLVMKGHESVVASPDGRVYINKTGNPGMAKGGSGDILAGMIAAIMAQCEDHFISTTAGVYLHGMAGDMASVEFGEVGMTPFNILEHLPKAIKNVRGI